MPETTPAERWRAVGPVSPDAEPIDPDWQPLGSSEQETEPAAPGATYYVQIRRARDTQSRWTGWVWRIIDGAGLIIERSQVGDHWPRADSASLAGRHALADLQAPYLHKRDGDGWETVHEETCRG